MNTDKLKQLARDLRKTCTVNLAAGLDAMKFKEFVATGAADDEVDHWIRENTTQKDPTAIIKWNNEMRCLRLCDLSQEVQEYFETYIPQFCHPPSKVKFFFDVYDVEEGVL
jgi:hypothetical protein